MAGSSDWRVPVAPVAAAIDASGKTYLEVAKALGWERRQTRSRNLAVDADRLRKALGVRVQHKGSCRYFAKTISVDLAERIAEIVDIPRWEIGC